MSSRLTMGGFAMGVLLLVMALFIPTLIGASQEDTQETLNISDGSSEELTDSLTVSAQSVFPSGNNATIQYEDQDSLATNSMLLNHTETKTVTLSGDNLTTTLNDTTGDSALVQVSYPPMFGWESNTRSFMTHLDTILGILGAVTILGSLAMGAKS